MKKTTRIVFDLDEDETKEVTIYAMYRHVGGPRPLNAMAKEALFAWMRKYAVPAGLLPQLEEKYQGTIKSP